MHTKNLTLGEEYYSLVANKDAEGIKRFLHPDVELRSPLATVQGKEAVAEATSGFMKGIRSLTIRAKFGSEQQAMVVYESDIPGIAPSFPGASLLTIEDGLIVKIQLFFDGTAFAKLKEATLSKGE